MEPTEQDLQAIQSILDENAIFEPPNIVFHIYKNRRSQLKRVRLWSRADLGTCRIEDLFVTTVNYEMIEMRSIHITTEREQKRKEEQVQKALKKYSQRL